MKNRKEIRNIGNYSYILIHKDMKSISMKINREGQLEVHCPYFVDSQRVDALVMEKMAWIQKRTDIVGNRKEMLEMDDSIVLWGKKYPLELRNGSKRFDVLEDKIVVYHPHPEEKQSVKNYLDSTLKKILAEEIEKDKLMCEEMIQDYRISSPTIRYRDMSSRWGSCLYNKKQITMNTRLVHYPKKCTEYVLLHEYTHLIVPNHSQRFYSIIAQRMSDYREREKCLNGYHFTD